jgi:hypothetical protein
VLWRQRLFYKSDSLTAIIVSTCYSAMSHSYRNQALSSYHYLPLAKYRELFKRFEYPPCNCAMFVRS